MASDTYHHKDLKDTLLQEGIRLINEQGMEAFSMRRLAAVCGVSHMAPYKHFQDKDEFFKELTRYIEKQFYECLKSTAELYAGDSERCLLELGKSYVNFMVSHPDYLKYFFLGAHHHKITSENIRGVTSACSLGVFRDCAMQYFRDNTCILAETYDDEIIFYWSLPMGLSTMYAYEIMAKDEHYLDHVENILRREILLRGARGDHA